MVTQLLWAVKSCTGLDTVFGLWYVNFTMNYSPSFKTPYKISGLSWKDNSNDNSKVSAAKKYPIEKLYTGKLRKMGKVLMGICPFHDERTASFAIYPDNNSWHCFACGIGGDSISFYMKQTGQSFVQALEELNDR